jgi:hypothetical protein
VSSERSEFQLEDASTIRAAENQSIFRTINERVGELNQGATFSEVAEWVCECADMSCTERISMTVAEYKTLRSDGNTFAVLAGHEVPEVEQVVRRTDRYLVVSKRPPGNEIARRLDPRRGSSSGPPADRP